MNLPVEMCLLLRDCGFPQKHNQYSRYYLGEEFYIDFETSNKVFLANELRANGEPESINPSRDLIFIPRLDDLWQEVGSTIYQISPDKHGIIVYGKFIDPEKLDRYVVEGKTLEEALCNLYYLYNGQTVKTEPVTYSTGEPTPSESTDHA